MVVKKTTETTKEKKPKAAPKTAAKVVKKVAEKVIEAGVTPKPKASPVAAPKVTANLKINGNLDYHQAVGRRKSATAIVRLYPKDSRGVILINNQPMEQYFPHFELQKLVTEALSAADMLGRYTISVKTMGGGKKGQAEATRHGLSRLLLSLDEGLHATLRAQGFLTRDPRVKERKKPGLKKARKAPQWSKR